MLKGLWEAEMQVRCITVGGLQENCYVIWQEEIKEAIVIDPGDKGDRIADRLEEKGLKCAAIMLTHGHFDHILGVEKLKERTGAPVMAGSQEKELLLDSDLNVSRRVRHPAEISCDRFFEDMEKVEIAGCSFTCIFTPGHTKGSVCYYFEKDKVIFTGDTLFNNGIGRTDLPTGNETELFSSIRSRLLTLPADTRCYPGHGEATDIESERQNFWD